MSECAACTVSIRESDPCVYFPPAPLVWITWLVTGLGSGEEVIPEGKNERKTGNSIEIRDYL